MICPEGTIPNETITKEDEPNEKRKNKTPGDGLEVHSSYKNPKTWKKSITNFFRQQLRSTKSNDGDRPSGSKESFENKAMVPEQKWQSLGKVFRRQSFVDHWNKGTDQQGECSTPSKRPAVRKALLNYFGKSQKSDKS